MSVTTEVPLRSAPRTMIRAGRCGDALTFIASLMRTRSALRGLTLALTCCRSWVGTRRVTLLHVSSSPRLAPCLRLSPHPAQHLGSVSIAKAMKHRFPFRWHPQKFIRVSSHFANMHEHNARAQLARSLGTLFPTYLCTPYFQRLGAFAM